MKARLHILLTKEQHKQLQQEAHNRSMQSDKRVTITEIVLEALREANVIK